MKKFAKFVAVVSVVALSVGLSGLVIARAATRVSLGSADNFAVLAGSTITNTGSSVINGDLGLTPGSSVTGFPAGTINGAQHIADTQAIQAQTDLTSAYIVAEGQAPLATIPTELGGTTQKAGVYDSTAGTFSITGTLTLDAENNPDAVFVFKTASTLITDGSSSVKLINGAQACNIFWQVGSSATLGANSTFKGNIIALMSVTLTTGVKLDGRALARNGAVTLDNNVITKTTCTVAVPTPTPTPIIAPVVVTSTPVIISAPIATTTVTIIEPTVTTVPALAIIPSLPSTGVGPSNK